LFGADAFSVVITECGDSGVADAVFIIILFLKFISLTALKTGVFIHTQPILCPSQDGDGDGDGDVVS
jgi:hypothetical protein